MAVTSKLGLALSAIASAIGSVPGITWGTSPAAKWYADFDNDSLKSAGLTAFVVPAASDYQPVSRGRSAKQLPEIWVAVFKPMSADSLDEGDAVIVVAEAIASALYEQRVVVSGQVSAVCTEAKFDPAISADYAKQFNLWCCLLKLEFNLS